MMVVIKTVHEFGHSFACRRFGGEVHTMGIMFLLFTPIPYMDATASWSFRSRWQRALVGAAGMIVEVFVASLATFVWASTAPGTIHSLAYNMMFVASVSTVLFNANPLLRFDGYYILSDLLDIPNLHQRSTGLLRHFVEFMPLDTRKSINPTRSRRETRLAGSFRGCQLDLQSCDFCHDSLFPGGSFSHPGDHHGPRVCRCMGLCPDLPIDHLPRQQSAP